MKLEVLGLLSFDSSKNFPKLTLLIFAGLAK